MIGYCNIKHGISYNNPGLILNALLRNFSSKPDFIEELFPKFPKNVPLISDKKITTRELIYQNINRRIFQEFGFEDTNDTPNYSRHMMILTDKICNLSFILKEIEQLSTKTDYKLFFGSDFAENKKQTRIIRNLQSIEDSIRNGEIVILFKNEQLYEPLYDLLNQNYSKKENEIFAKISFGNIVSKIKIDPKFRLIVISDKSRAYNVESPAILNRFEKYLLISEEFITKNEFIRFYQKQKEIIQNICKFADITEEKLLVSYHTDLLPSLVTKLQQILSEKEKQEKEDYLRVEGVNMWMRICNYESMLSIYLKTIKKYTTENIKEISYLRYIWQRYLSLYHDSLNDLIQTTLIPKQIQCSVVLTSSSISQTIKSEQIQNFKFKEIELSKIENDTQFEKEVRKNLGLEPIKKTNPYKDENFALIIRFTPTSISPETIFHQSKYMIENLIKKEEIKCKIIFIVHLPSTQQSKTQFHFAFEKNWEYFYIDDILPSEIKFPIISESKDSDLNFLENILDQEWEKLFEPIFNSSILQFINPEKIQSTKPFLEKMKTLKDLIFPKLKFMFEKGKKENISFYQWDIQELITQKLRMQQSYESFNSYLYSQLIKKLETIFAILLSYIMVNDNFKLILTTSKEKENFWKQIFELIEIQPYHKIQKDQFDKSEFPFFHYFYEVITEDYHQENKDILKDIVDEPIENWLENFSKRKDISEKYLKNFLNDLIGISFNESEKEFFKDYIQDFQKFILHFEESQINSLTKFSLREIYQKINWEIFQQISSIYKLVNEFNQNQNQNKNQFGEFSLNRFFDSQLEIIKNSLNKNNSPNELIPIGTCIDKIYDFLNQLTNYTKFERFISELFKKWSNIYFLFQTKTKNLSKISQTQEFKSIQNEISKKEFLSFFLDENKTKDISDQELINFFEIYFQILIKISIFQKSDKQIINFFNKINENLNSNKPNQRLLNFFGKGNDSFKFQNLFTIFFNYLLIFTKSNLDFRKTIFNNLKQYLKFSSENIEWITFTFLQALFQYTKNDFYSHSLFLQSKLYPEIDQTNDIFQEYSNSIQYIHHIIQNPEDHQKEQKFEEKFLQVFRQNEILDKKGFFYGFCLEYLKGKIKEDQKHLVLTRITSSFTENQNLNEKQNQIKETINYILSKVDIIKENFQKIFVVVVETGEKYLKTKHVASPLFNEINVGFLTNEKLYENIFGISDYEEPNQMFSLRDTKFIIPTKIARIIHFSLKTLDIIEKNHDSSKDIIEDISILIYNEMKHLSNLLNLTLSNTKLYYILFLSKISTLNTNELDNGTIMNKFQKWEDLLQNIYINSHEEILKQINIEKIGESFKFKDLLFISPSSNLLLSQFLKPSNIKNIQKYPITQFFLDNFIKFKMIDLLPSFLKFISLINSQYNSKISFQESNQIKITDFIKIINEEKQEMKENIDNWIKEFKECWKLCLCEMNNDEITQLNKNFIEIKQDSQLNQIEERVSQKIQLISEDSPIIKVLSYPNNSPNIDNLVNYICNEYRKLKEIFNETFLNQKGIKKPKEKMIKFPIKIHKSDINNRTIDETFNFDFKEINEYMQFYYPENDFEKFEMILKQKLVTFFKKDNISIIVSNFQFTDLILLDISFLNDSRWNQMDIPQQTWNQILDELIEKFSIKNFKLFYENIIHLCSNIQKVDSLLPEQTLFVFANQFGIDILGLENVSLIHSLKLKHLRFIKNNIDMYSENILKKIDKSYLSKIPPEYEKSLDLFCQKIDLDKLIIIFEKFLFENLFIEKTRTIQTDQKIKEYLHNISILLQYEGESGIIKDHFPQEITSKYTGEAYRYIFNKRKQL
ncbi:e3 ubiquitin-protein ligase rnf213 [Anaeramoeba ignava]|uniref:E3 ubiquitin-protein ligase rnf213 n=1 Tax=Anaeramoeba ignava TaxID=1746090 RepID=A0A9Q0LI59_ANAIG|nr:e3 ubiquitin-protein ligase rnf213 [Anaeramoeba ignava]